MYDDLLLECALLVLCGEVLLYRCEEQLSESSQCEKVHSVVDYFDNFEIIIFEKITINNYLLKVYDIYEGELLIKIFSSCTC